MTNRAAHITALVASLLVFPNGSEAQAPSTWDFGTVCVPHTFKVCAGVSITTIYRLTDAPAGTTRLQVRWSNPQGLPGFKGPITGLRSLTIRGFELAEGSPVPEAGSNGILIETTGHVTRHSASPDMDNFRKDALSSYFTFWTIQEDGHLFGCDLPSWIDEHPEWDATCDGSITYATDFFNGHMLVGQKMSLDLFWNAWHPASTSPRDYLAQGLTCTTGVDCRVVPEPGTAVLLLTGLLGLAGVTASRRRKGASA